MNSHVDLTLHGNTNSNPWGNLAHSTCPPAKVTILASWFPMDSATNLLPFNDRPAGRTKGLELLNKPFGFRYNGSSWVVQLELLQWDSKVIPCDIVQPLSLTGCFFKTHFIGSFANGCMDLKGLGNIPTGLTAIAVPYIVHKQINILEFCVIHQNCFIITHFKCAFSSKNTMFTSVWVNNRVLFCET